MSDRGRGAWPSNGRGGTLMPVKGSSNDAPGPYYMLAQDPMKQIGLGTWCRRANGEPVSLDYNATFHAVVAIQMLCNNHELFISNRDKHLSCDGIFGPETEQRIKVIQTHHKIAVDGIVGRNTMKVLLMPYIKNAAFWLDVKWEVIFGILHFEGNWDPGAVGVLDPSDLGLAQINTSTAHPHISLAEAFCASFAINFVGKLIKAGLEAFDGRYDLAIASYNLGIGGTRQWIADGSPDLWTPPWTKHGERPVKRYINNIMNAHKMP